MGTDSSDAKNELLELDDPVTTGPTTGAPPSNVVDKQLQTVRPPEGIPIRDRLTTITDEDALEEARIASMASRAPPPRRPYSTRPGALEETGADDPDAAVEVDTDEFDIEALGEGEQVAILRARLAPMSRVPTLARSMTELGALLEDPKTAYVLGFVDGLLPLDTIVEVTGLPELETLRILDRMTAQVIVVFRSMSPSPR